MLFVKQTKFCFLFCVCVCVGIKVPSPARVMLFGHPWYSHLSFFVNIIVNTQKLSVLWVNYLKFSFSFTFICSSNFIHWNLFRVIRCLKLSPLPSWPPLSPLPSPPLSSSSSPLPPITTGGLWCGIIALRSLCLHWVYENLCAYHVVICRKLSNVCAISLPSVSVAPEKSEFNVEKTNILRVQMLDGTRHIIRK